MFQVQGVDILFLFFVAAIISTLVNYQYDFWGNIKCIMWMAIQVFLLQALDSTVSLQKHISWLNIIFNIFIFLWTVAVVWSLVLYVMQVSGSMETVRMEIVRSLYIGFVDGRLHGIFEDPNYAVISSWFTIAFAVFCMRWGKQKRKWNIYYIICIVLQLCYVVLSNSRTGVLAVLTVSAFASTFLTIAKIKQNIFIKAAGGILVGLFSIAIVLVAYYLLQTGLSYVPSLMENFQYQVSASQNDNITSEVTEKILLSESEEEKETSGKVDFSRSDVENKDDISNNRFKIWSDYISVFQSKPLFGASPRGYFSYVEDQFSDLYIVGKRYINVHNAYLLLFVAVGVFGGAIMMIWLIKTSYLIMKYLITHWKERDDVYWMVFLFTLALLAVATSAMTLQDIFFCNMIQDILFWLVLGINLYLIRSQNAKQLLRKSLIEQGLSFASKKLCSKIGYGKQVER